MNQKDIYDIIVENLTKEWELSMKNQKPSIVTGKQIGRAHV